MPATKVDILESDRWFTNSDYALNCYVKQADGTTAQNIAGWTLSWVLKKRASDPDANALITKTTVSGITIVDAAQGHARISIAKADTDATFKSGTFHHELKRTDAGLYVVVIYGLAVIKRSAHLS